MTDNLFEKLEEKVTVLLSELTVLRKELNQVRQENAALKLEKTQYTQKVQELISLFDLIDPATEGVSHEPIRLQGEQEKVAVA